MKLISLQHLPPLQPYQMRILTSLLARPANLGIPTVNLAAKPMNDDINPVVFDQLKEILADLLTADPAAITPESRLIEDLGCDSLDMVDLAYVISDEFGTPEIPDSKLETLLTVQDILNLIDDSQNTPV